MSTIILKNIGKQYHNSTGSLDVLYSINIKFNKGRTAIIHGDSGAGKSTLLQIVAGLEKPTKGSIYFDDVNITNFIDSDLTEMRKQYLGILSQTPYFIDDFSVLENVMLPGLIAGLGYQEARSFAFSLLETFGVEQKSLEHPSSLSGGEQQRVALARALFNKPSFLVADEPTAHLDDDNVKNMVNLMCAMQLEHKMGIIIVTHDVRLSSIEADHFFLSNGMLVSSRDHTKR